MSDTTQSSNHRLIIELGGEIDLANAQSLGDALCEAIDRTHRDMVVDLSAVPFMDACGMGMLARVHAYATRNGCAVTWRGIQPLPKRVVALVGLDGILHFEP
jgi:anti-anti-sigma factor